METPGRLLEIDNPFYRKTTADSYGSFRITAIEGIDCLKIVHPEGWRTVTPDELLSAPIVTLSPWSHVKGMLRVGSSPGVRETVCLRSEHWGQPALSGHDPITFIYSTTTDHSGRFAFDNVPAGRALMYRAIKLNEEGPQLATQSKDMFVAPAGVTWVTLGGQGVRVVGRLRGAPMRADIIWTGMPHILRFPSPEPGPQTGPLKGFGFFCREDGSFVIGDVPLGNYVLAGMITVGDPTDPVVRAENYLGAFRVPVRIPADITELDIGVIEVPVKAE